ncbi:Dynein heavy chain [Balamuthia mandrillaris]
MCALLINHFLFPIFLFFFNLHTCALFQQIIFLHLFVFLQSVRTSNKSFFFIFLFFFNLYMHAHFQQIISSSTFFCYSLICTYVHTSSKSLSFPIFLFFTTNKSFSFNLYMWAHF